MNKVPIPLLVVFMAFPMVGETIYTPSLPLMANDLGVSLYLVEMTLSVYLAGFAFGVAIWGVLADRFGRRPAMLAGLTVYVLASLACLLIADIYFLLGVRLLQALGASAGSVVAQTMIRDQFDGPSRGKLFSTMSIALALGPAIGTTIGGFIAKQSGYQGAFLFLTLTGLLIATYCIFKLSETRPMHIERRSLVELFKMVPHMLQNRHILKSAGLIALSNGIMFSFYGEAPFVLIELWGMKEEFYGLVGLLITLAGVASALVSRGLIERLTSEQLVQLGSFIALAGGILMCSAIIAGTSHPMFVIGPMAVVCFGIGTIIPNTLNMALRDYKAVLGTAGALFGFLYYAGITILSSGMSLLHNGSASILPIYIAVQALGLVVVCASPLSWVKLIRKTCRLDFQPECSSNRELG